VRANEARARRLPKGEAPLMTDLPKCPDCATVLDVITYYDAKSSAPVRQLSWCPNPECKLFGEGIEERREPSGPSQSLTPIAGV